MNQIYLRTLSVWSVLIMVLPLAQTDWIMECKMCRCKWNSGKKTADCKNEELIRVPIGLSNELQVLDLSNNFLPEIAPNEFSAANLRNLHKLFVRNSTLKQIHRDSLKGLEILIELDLSYNLLKTLPRIVFNNLVKLRVLMLNNNKLERLEDGLFRNLKFLHKIELKSNQLVHIESKAFTNLPVLTQIYLDGNQLNVLNRECFQHLEKLTGLSLKQNPWNCTCELRSFRDFSIEQNLYTPPTDCHYPEHLRGTLWTDVGVEAFACKPKILYPSIDEATISSYNENSTITCRIQASPNTAITWTYNRHAIINYPKRILIKNTSVAGNGRGGDGNDIITSELTIIGARRTDEGIYTCSAENVGGRAEIDIQLLIGRDNNGMLFLSNRMLFVLCLMVVGLLMISMVIMIVTCCYCRKFKSLIKNDLDDGMSGVAGISIGADGTLNGSNSKKHFQAIKLNSLKNNATTMIGNGKCIVTNATDCIDDDSIAKESIAMDVIVGKNGGINKIGNDLEMDKFASIEFNRPNTKSDLIVADAHYSTKLIHQSMTDKKTTDSSEIRLHQTVSTTNNVILSPTRQIYVPATDHATTHQTLQRHGVSDARLPPDLLSYGQHQSLILQSSLKNSSSSSTGSSTSTAILDHRIIPSTYNNATNANHSINADRSSNRYPYNGIFCDELNENYHDNVDGNDDDIQQLFLRQTPIEEPDLRIYHTVGIMKKASTPTTPATMPKYGTLNSSSPTMSSANITTTNKLSSAFPSYRSKNIYELTPASTILNTNYNNNAKHLNRTFNSNTLKAQPTTATTIQPNRPMDPNCKLRQSVVRTSPSFSFLSTGYNQQQDNFL